MPGWVNELRALGASGRVLEARHATVSGSDVQAVRVVLDTSDISPVPTGFAVKGTEEVFIAPGDRYPDVPPTVFVGRDARFVGYPHVICARQLCIYLDPGREWNPTYGMAQVIDRTWGWFDNAANDRFDPRTSLFHAVGGASPVTHPIPMVVVREPTPAVLSTTAALKMRSATRLDLSWRTPKRSHGERPVAVFNVPRFLPFGLVPRADLLAALVEGSGGVDAAAFIGAVQGLARACPAGEPIYLVLVVAHPTDAHMKALVVGRVPVTAADRIRQPQPTITPSETPIEWIPVSDERPSVTTRRDSLRPASHLAGKSIELWGCGGLGSWIGELCARAGAAKITLRDHGQIHGGHLVRQNFTEADVGDLKTSGLAKRLRALSDTLVVEQGTESIVESIAAGLPDCDLIIDATISETIAHRLDSAARGHAGRRPLLVQVALDRRSATLGLIVTADEGVACGPATIDRSTGELVKADDGLEAFHTFWTPPVEGGELVPAPGCSVPTYHGSAADLAAIAGVMVSVVGQQVAAPVAGAHLVASPHSGVQPSWRFIQLVGEAADVS